MSDWQSVVHVCRRCRYHIAWVPKHRRKKLYGEVQHRFGEMIKEPCRQCGIEVFEGHVMADHVYVFYGFPAGYSLANTVGSSKGKRAIGLHRQFNAQRSGIKHRWMRGYYASVVEYDDKEVR